MLDLKDATAFLRLCETSNLTRTATLCHVSPSTLSRTLNKLEKELGAKLCIRDKKGVFITEAGRKFEAFARKVLEAIHPRDSWRASKAFRSHIAVESAKRCLIESVKLAGGVL